MVNAQLELEQSRALWNRLGWPSPDVVVVTGSGLGVDLGPAAYGPVPFAEILALETHAVIGHAHTAEILRPLPDRTVLYLRGRLHAYQGYDPHQVVLPIRLAASLGARLLLATNAAGGLVPEDGPGTLKLIADHLNLTGLNPLRGELPSAWGPRFPDLTVAYSPALRRRLHATAAELGIPLGEGVYAGLLGPSYETPAEVRMLGRMGADLVGMSTVLEVIAARHMGLTCAALSLITNLAAGVTEAPLDHEEVLEHGRAAAGNLGRLLRAALARADLLEL